MLNQMLRAGSGGGTKPLQPLPEGPNPAAAATAGSAINPILPGAAKIAVVPTTQPVEAAGMRRAATSSIAAAISNARPAIPC